MENWREKAKELGISLYHRKKDDVIREIENKAVKKSEDMKITIEPRKAFEICVAALRGYVIEQGMDGDKEIIWEKWFVNCKRKGIVFRGKAKNEYNSETREDTSEVSRATPCCSSSFAGSGEEN